MSDNLNPNLNAYEHGLAGLAKILGCTERHASRLKKTGKLDSAIQQIGRKIIVNTKKLLELKIKH